MRLFLWSRIEVLVTNLGASGTAFLTADGGVLEVFGPSCAMVLSGAGPLKVRSGDPAAFRGTPCRSVYLNLGLFQGAGHEVS